MRFFANSLKGNSVFIKPHEGDKVRQDIESTSLDDEVEWMASLVRHERWSEKHVNIRSSLAHPWLELEDLKDLPARMFEAYESIFSSYFSLFCPEFKRAELNQLLRKKFSSAAEVATCEKLRKRHLQALEKRRQFLNNLLDAVRNPTSDYENQPKREAIPQKPPAGYGFTYFIRNGDLCKIGITGNLLRRMNELAPDEILNVMRCSNYQQLEHDLHEHFKEVRLPQTEYFRLNDEQVQEAHQLMAAWALF